MKRLLRDERGANVVEYAIILGFVVLVAIAALTLIGVEANSMVSEPVLADSLA